MVSEYRGHTAEILDFTINRYQLVTKYMFFPTLKNVGKNMQIQHSVLISALCDIRGVCEFRSPFQESVRNISLGFLASA